MTESVSLAALTEYAARKLSEPQPDIQCPAFLIPIFFAVKYILRSYSFLEDNILMRVVIFNNVTNTSHFRDNPRAVHFGKPVAPRAFETFVTDLRIDLGIRTRRR